MKKLLLLVSLSIFLSLGLSACGNNGAQKEESAPKKAESASKKEDAGKEKKKTSIKFPDKELGKGRFILRTESGSSENGNIPFMYREKDELTPFIGFEAWEFDDSKLSYIYIDDTLNLKTKFSDIQTFLDLTAASEYEVGTHEIKVVQFDNDKETGKVVTYKTAKYEIKSK
ncbi:hypothetical protein C2D64_00085 [Listeria ivanovii]|uniref:hypothetical protein n=1 Tax=Listeria ivanovii TaxID=1638 RepID=UPI000DA8A573|nr:hypothetical protein [Listeria ivanovii]PZG35467.1 hypothetical protein C2D64_00085 [Listeria ivanovii]PZG46446.1 hypothetical protein C2D66_11025 [Listeria ivanovii]PZH13426.1 hypothetical protein C2D65_00080 [Listeria ivanovii]